MITGIFLRELGENHVVDDAVFLVDSAPRLQTAPARHGLTHRHEVHGDRNAVERVSRELKRRTHPLSNTFSHVAAETAETWLQAFAVRHSWLI